MNRRQFLAASGVGVAATTAGCVGDVLGSDDGTGDGDDEDGGTDSESEPGTGAETDAVGHREITVSTDGEVETEPDMAEVSIGVEARGASAEDATGELAAGADRLREAFDELGIPDDDVEEGQYRVTPVPDRDEEPDEVRGVHSFDVTIVDVDRVGEVIDGAVAAGADDIGRVNFTLHDDTREERRKDAIDEALANADAEAEHVAANRGVELVGTKSVTTNDVRVHTVGHRVSFDLAADDDAAAGTEIDADPVSVSASVTVSYGFRET